MHTLPSHGAHVFWQPFLNRAPIHRYWWELDDLKSEKPAQCLSQDEVLTRLKNNAYLLFYTQHASIINAPTKTCDDVAAIVAAIKRRDRSKAARIASDTGQGSGRPTQGVRRTGSGTVAGGRGRGRGRRGAQRGGGRERASTRPCASGGSTGQEIISMETVQEFVRYCQNGLSSADNSEEARMERLMSMLCRFEDHKQLPHSKDQPPGNDDSKFARFSNKLRELEDGHLLTMCPFSPHFEHNPKRARYCTSSCVLASRDSLGSTLIPPLT